MEKRADNLFAKLESIRGILDRIAQSQTDKMVRTDVFLLCVGLLSVLCSSLNSLQVMQAYQAGVSALRLSLKDMSVERAENLVDQIQEVR